MLDRLWIGSVEDLNAPLQSLGFTGLVDLRGGPFEPNSSFVFSLRNRDGDPWDRIQVEQALDFIADRIQKGRVLVACTAGMSRSASMVIGFLVRTGWDSASAYALVRQARPKILPLAKMLESALAPIEAINARMPS